MLRPSYTRGRSKKGVPIPHPLLLQLAFFIQTECLPTLLAQQSPPPVLVRVTSAKPLDEMQGRYRPLIVFGAPNDGIEFAKQTETVFAHGDESIGRQVMVLFLGHAWAGAVIPQLMSTGYPNQERLWKRFHVRHNEFTVILVGKDGEEKLRSHTAISFEQLRDTIDKMPMRQQEMRERKLKP